MKSKCNKSDFANIKFLPEYYPLREPKETRNYRILRYGSEFMAVVGFFVIMFLLLFVFL